MTDRKFNVYSTMIMVRGGEGRDQKSVYTAAASRKRASELFDVTERYMAEFGGSTGQKAVIGMCRAEPEVVFVQIDHGVYSRLGDLADPSKRITLDVGDEEQFGREQEHPAFGQIHVSRVTGHRNLFMVDYPQDGWVELVIERASLNRSGGHDRIYGDQEIMRVALSSVQWAQMLSSMNTQGVPCTLARYTDPHTGDFMTPKLPDKHVADTETFKNDVRNRADKATKGISEAAERLAEIMKGPLRKGDLAEVQDLLHTAKMMLASNLTYVVETAEKTIDAAAKHGQAEVDSHIDFAMMRLGERALGDRLQQALETGADLRIVGRNVLLALDDKSPESGDT